jgi:hypothetical protein
MTQDYVPRKREWQEIAADAAKATDPEREKAEPMWVQPEKRAFGAAVVRVRMAGSPPLTHDRITPISTTQTISIYGLDDCSLLYSFHNKPQ